MGTCRICFWGNCENLKHSQHRLRSRLAAVHQKVRACSFLILVIKTISSDITISLQQKKDACCAGVAQIHHGHLVPDGSMLPLHRSDRWRLMGQGSY